MAREKLFNVIKNLGVFKKAEKMQEQAAAQPEQLRLFGTNAPTMDPTVAPTVPSFLDVARAANATRTARQAERAAAGKLPFSKRAVGFAVRRPKTALGLGLGVGTAGYLSGVPSAIASAVTQPEADEFSLTGIRALTPRESYMQEQQNLINSAYNISPTQKLQLQVQAQAKAEQLAAEYEKIGRSDLAAAARANTMSQFNNIMLANELAARQQAQEAIGIAQDTARELADVRMAPSELRQVAMQYDNEYQALSAEDRDYYSSLGYDTREKYINGRINGKI